MKLWRLTPSNIRRTGAIQLIRRNFIRVGRREFHSAYHHPPLHLLQHRLYISQSAGESSLYSPEDDTFQLSGQGNTSSTPDDAALTRLQAILSGPHKTRVSSINTIKSLYTSIRHRLQVHLLTPSDISSLIFLFGYLSATEGSKTQHDYNNTNLYRHGIFEEYYSQTRPIIIELKGNAYRPHWPFLVLLATDKQKLLKCPLNANDHYWLMNASLKALHTNVSSGPKSNMESNSDVENRLSKIRYHYMSLVKFGKAVPWDVHIEFLKALESVGTPGTANEILRQCLYLASKKNLLRPQVSEIFWRTLAHYANAISDETKGIILNSLKYRLNEQIGHTEEQSPSNVEYSKEAFSSHYSEIGVANGYFSDIATDATYLRNILGNIITGDLPMEFTVSRGNRLLVDWAIQEIRSTVLFSFKTPEDMQIAFNYLYLLALSYNVDSRDLRSHGLQPSIVSARGFSWVVVCTLATLQTFFQNITMVDKLRESRLLWQQGRDLYLSLWTVWVMQRQTKTGTPVDHANIACHISISFIRIAMVIGDVELQGLLLNGIGETMRFPQASYVATILEPSVVLAAELATMIALNGTREWEEIFALVRESGLCIPGDGFAWERRVMNSVVSRLVLWFPGDTELLETLCSSGLAKGVFILAEDTQADKEIENTTEHLSSPGALSDVIRYLHEGTLEIPSPRLIKILNNTLVHLSLSGQKSYYLDRRLVALLSNVLGRIITGSKAHPATILSFIDSAAFEWTLIVLVRANFVSEAVNVVQRLLVSIWELQLHPLVGLSDHFLQNFVRKLLYSRLYRSLALFIENMPLSHPQTALVVETFLSLEPQFQMLPLQQKCKILRIRRDWGSLYKLLSKNDLHAPYRVLTLKLMERLMKYPSEIDTRTLEDLLSILVHTGRVRAAMRCIRAVSKCGRNDVISVKCLNIVLTGCFRSSQPRLGRKQGQFLQQLKQLNFIRSVILDRVTLNLWLKCHIEWYRGNDTRSIRFLFDLLILNGYPSGSISHSQAENDLHLGSFAITQEAPFGTLRSDTKSSAMMKTLAAFTGPIDFERHVKPLYLMFVKAFHIRGDKEAAYKVIGIYQQIRRQI